MDGRPFDFAIRDDRKDFAAAYFATTRTISRHLFE